MHPSAFSKRWATKPTEHDISRISDIRATFRDLAQCHQTTLLLSRSACYAELQQRCPRDVVLAHFGHALCFKIVEEADKVPGKCLSWWKLEEVEEPIITTCLISFCFNVLVGSSAHSAPKFFQLANFRTL